MRPTLIILGIIEIPFALLALFSSIPLVQITKALEDNQLLPIIGIAFFFFTILVGVIQILMGFFSWDKKIGKKKTKIIIASGILLGVLTIPAILIFIVSPIYGIASSIK